MQHVFRSREASGVEARNHGEWLKGTTVRAALKARVDVLLPRLSPLHPTSSSWVCSFHTCALICMN